jgi:hypothetical protein
MAASGDVPPRQSADGSDSAIDARRAPSPLEGLPLAVLVGIGGGLAGLTFFTFMGGVITVARFRGAGLSGTKAVALVPKSDLLAVGAQVLLLPILIALVALVPFVMAERSDRRRRLVLTVLGAGGVIVGCTVIALSWPIRDWTADEFEAVAALVVVAGVGGLAVDGMAERSEPTGGHTSRVPAAVLLFLVVAVFVAVESYGMSYARPTVHPMAVVFADKQRSSGIYVGETNSRVWMGRVIQQPAGSNHGDRSRGLIIELSRSDLSKVAIGASLPLSEAIHAGPTLAAALRASP